MIVCSTTGPSRIPDWKEVCVLGEETSWPEESLEWECQPWAERVIEGTLVRQPELLAKALGLCVPQKLLILKQVKEIDIYLRAEDSLHLLEVKRPRGYGKWREAAEQITRQYAAAQHWLRQGAEPVFLWAVIPVRWSRRRGVAKEPENWKSGLAAIRAERLANSSDVQLGFLFYTTFRCAKRLYLVFWTGNESAPEVKTLKRERP